MMEEPFLEKTIHSDLELVSTLAGRALLRAKGVKGADEELEKAVEAFGNHALAVRWLAAYLGMASNFEIGGYKDVPHIDISEEKGKHPRRLLAVFEELFGEGAKLQLLKLLGFFDRPLEGEVMDALVAEPSIAGLTDCLQGISEEEKRDLLGQLRETGLLTKESHHHSDTIDAHPLLREHFRDALQKDHDDAWREGNLRLYEYYKGSAKEKPDTLEEMTPLFLAMGHGCAAGRFEEALDEIYWKQIQRGAEHFNWKKLGAFGFDLTALAGLFEERWSKPVAILNEGDKGFVLDEAGYDLVALGRLSEAVEPMEVGLKSRIKHESLDECCRKCWKSRCASAHIGGTG